MFMNENIKELLSEYDVMWLSAGYCFSTSRFFKKQVELDRKPRGFISKYIIY